MPHIYAEQDHRHRRKEHVMSNRMSRRQREYFDDIVARDQQRRSNPLRFVWRLERRLLALAAIFLLALAVFAFLPLVLGWVLSVAWPLLPFAFFAVVARVTGDRVGVVTYFGRLVGATRANWPLVQKVAAAAAVIAAGVGVVALVGGDTAVAGALAKVAGTFVSLMTVVVVVLELATRNGTASQPVRQVEQEDAPGPRAHRQSSAPIDSGPVQPKQLDAPGPRSASNRKVF